MRFFDQTVIVLVILGCIYLCINIRSHIMLTRVGRWIPLKGVIDRVSIVQRLGNNGASVTFDMGRNTPYIKFQKKIGQDKPTRFQMILRREDYMAEEFDKAWEVLSSKCIPFRVANSDEDDEYNEKPSKTDSSQSHNDSINKSKQELAELVVECGKNLELADYCAQTVFSEAFGVSPNAKVRLTSYGRWDMRGVSRRNKGIGFGNYNESIEYQVTINSDVIETIISILNKLDESSDEDAFVMFGVSSHPIPTLKKSKTGNETTFIVDLPSFDRTSQNALKMMREKGYETKIIEQTKLGPIYRIALGSSKENIAAILNQMLSVKQDRKFENKFYYRFVEVITADWQPDEKEEVNAEGDMNSDENISSE